MTTRTRGPIAGYGWLWAGVQLLGRRPGTLLGAAAMVMGLSLVPSLVSLVMQYAQPHSQGVSVGVMVLSLLFGLALGPAQGGFLQVVDAVVHDRPARALEVFAPYGRPEQRWRLVGFATVMMVVTGVLLVGAFASMGINPWSEQWQAAMAAQAQTGKPMQFPPQFWNVVGAIALLMPVVMALFAIGYGQVALAGTSVAAAVRDGIAGALRNLHVLWILLVGGTLMGLVVALILGIGVAIIAFLASLVGKVALLVVLGAFYIALILVMNVVMFGFMYAMWRDVCDVQDGGVPSGEAAQGTTVAA